MLLSHLHPHNLNRRAPPRCQRGPPHCKCDDLDKKCWGTRGDGDTFPDWLHFLFQYEQSKQRDRERKKEKKIRRTETFCSIFALLDICYLSLRTLIWEEKNSLSGVWGFSTRLCRPCFLGAAQEISLDKVAAQIILYE